MPSEGEWLALDSIDRVAQLHRGILGRGDSRAGARIRRGIRGRRFAAALRQSRNSPASPISWARTSWRFGLFQTDGETEPSEWRCLSKRDAQRFGQEIHMLAQAAGETKSETSLPSVMNGTVAGRRLFKDRREREAVAADPSKLMREVESNLSRRIGLLEAEVAEQTKKLRQVGTSPDLADERFKRLLSAMGNVLGVSTEADADAGGGACSRSGRRGHAGFAYTPDSRVHANPDCGRA